MTDVHTPKQRSRNMAAIKGKNTKPEMLVRRMLHRAGYRYSLHSKKLPGKPDLVFTSRRKVVLVHGCFWHVHSCRWGSATPKTRAAFWDQKRAANADRDGRHRRALKRLGWSVLVVWECEGRNPARLFRRLQAFLDRAGS